MSITPDQIKTIRTEFFRLKPARVSLDESRPLPVRELFLPWPRHWSGCAGAASTCRTDGEAARQGH